MTHTNPCPPQTTPVSHRSARSRHAANFSDAVVAVYIHEISERHAQSAATRPRIPRTQGRARR